MTPQTPRLDLNAARPGSTYYVVVSGGQIDTTEMTAAEAIARQFAADGILAVVYASHPGIAGGAWRLLAAFTPENVR